MIERIDLNADLGEGDPYDAKLMQYVTSCNIACGGHTGDAESMNTALAQAKRNHVAAGAHPSYPDREGFGRRDMDISITDLESSLITQISALKTFAEQRHITLTHVKPHGALYNRAAKDHTLATLLAQVTANLLPDAALVGPPASALEATARAAAINYTAEAFADRAYTDDGALVPRNQPGAVLATDAARTAQALAIASSQTVTSQSGQSIPMRAQTICLHGDSHGALNSAKAIRAALDAAGIDVRAPQ